MAAQNLEDYRQLLRNADRELEQIKLAEDTYLALLLGNEWAKILEQMPVAALVEHSDANYRRAGIYWDTHSKRSVSIVKLIDIVRTDFDPLVRCEALCALRFVTQQTLVSFFRQVLGEIVSDKQQPIQCRRIAYGLLLASLGFRSQAAEIYTSATFTEDQIDESLLRKD